MEVVFITNWNLLVEKILSFVNTIRILSNDKTVTEAIK